MRLHAIFFRARGSCSLTSTSTNVIGGVLTEFVGIKTPDPFFVHLLSLLIVNPVLKLYIEPKIHGKAWNQRKCASRRNIKLNPCW